MGATATERAVGTGRPSGLDRWLKALRGIARVFTSNRKGLAGGILLLIFLAVAILAPVLSPGNPSAMIFTQLQGPSLAHPLGTTSFSQDVLAQLIWGTRESLLIGVIAGVLTTLIAVLIGVTAAYLGGITDHLLAIGIDIFLVIPGVPLMIVVAAYVHGGGSFVLIVVISVTSWAFGARQLRSQALVLRNREFLEAARARGEGPGYTVVFEIVPTMTSLIMAGFLSAALYAVLAAAGLQFIGLGNPNDVSWGTMLYWAENNEALLAGGPLWAITPGVCIAVLGGAFALLNYAFDEVNNPALRAVRGARRVAGALASAVAAPAAGTEVANGSAAFAGEVAPEDGSASPLLSIRGLQVEYGGERPARAVDGVDLDVARGEFLGVVGESGCGKSSLLFALTGLLSNPARVVGGSVTFKGRDLVTMDEASLRHLRWKEYSVVMQSAMNALNPVLTIGAQMQDAMTAHSDMGEADRRERCAEMLRMVGVDPVHLKSYSHQLSGGMRQRAMIAMALLFIPDLVVMDEPTSALDVVAQRSLMIEIRRLQQRFGFAVVFVTHDMSLVGHFSDRIAVMYAGQIVEGGPTRQIFAEPKHPYTQGLLKASPSIRGALVDLKGIPGSPPDLTAPPPGCRFHPRCPFAEARCREQQPVVFMPDKASLVRCHLYQPDARTHELERSVN